MKPLPLSRTAIAAVFLTSGYLSGQTADTTPQPPAEASQPPATEGLKPGDIVPAPPQSSEEPLDVSNPSDGFGPLEKQRETMEEGAGIFLKDQPLNDVFQYLAREAGRQYFHNSKISSQEYRVTGHLNEGDPLQQMEELAFMYNLTIHKKGSTLYALTQVQLAQLPSIEFNYRLRYLRPTDIDQIKVLLKASLSPSGVIEFEPKTNTVIIVDNPQRVEAARRLLREVDRERGQIVVETKIMRINSTVAERTGVDWSASLGQSGVNLEAARSLNSVFGLPSSWGALVAQPGQPIDTPAATNNLVLSPIQLRGVLRALADGGIASQVSNPTLITEDNEQATISIIDRVPIVTATQSAGTGTTTSTEEVRYKIDDGDRTIDTDPENHREIGISIVVTPTLLPDGTVRMKLRPRSAQITEEIRSALSGNVYPRVTESMVESLARVPDGHSLVVGGFYGETKSNSKNKVPLLGDVPILNFFFKSKEASREQTSLVFIVTPTSYDPRDRMANNHQSDAIRKKSSLTPDYDWVDELNPGPAHEPNLQRGLRGLQSQQAPFYPRTTPYPAAEEARTSPPANHSAKSSNSSPSHSAPLSGRNRR